ncbi:hypothetical protein O181_001007 [Austropuccinia psidii MF-1]|uniref:Uncharacterized protein n=1 Tax=Austropuccinia psidii MF-1 TaxID=1389203 RepID=A0A9Q3GCL5_9BASI|nr:hypothetical protein [Austropuccinia psidii MF-1]
MRSPNDLLVSRPSTIQNMLNLNQLLPLRLKVMVRDELRIRKLHVFGKVMKVLTYEPYSDSLRVLYTISGKIRITKDFSQQNSDIIVILRKNICALPAKLEPPQPRMVNLPELRHSPTKKPSLNEGFLEVQSLSDNQMADHEPVPQKREFLERTNSKYAYVPYYDTEPLDVSSRISTQNIIEGGRRQRRPPDWLMLAIL